MKEIRRDDYEEDDDYDEEVNEDDGSDDSAGIELVVRIASVITGIIILSFIALLVKTKIVDRYVVPEPVEDIMARITGLEADISASLQALFHREN